MKAKILTAIFAILSFLVASYWYITYTVIIPDMEREARRPTIWVHEKNKRFANNSYYSNIETDDFELYIYQDYSNNTCHVGYMYGEKAEIIFEDERKN